MGFSSLVKYKSNELKGNLSSFKIHSVAFLSSVFTINVLEPLDEVIQACDMCNTTLSDPKFTGIVLVDVTDEV